MQAKPTLQMNDVLGDRYRIVSLIGKGGMSSVYLAEDMKLNRKKWAIKEMRTLPGYHQLFVREAEMLARLQHPNLPSIVDFFTSNNDGIGYLVMDYIEGITLDRWLQNRKKEKQPLRWQDVLTITLQLCRCLRYLHEFEPNPIIYRDLKPANVIINAKRHIYLVDFGIARQYDLNKHKDTVRLGTITFASPEQLEGKQTDARSDLYSLGALMYYLVTGGQVYNAVRRPLHKHKQPSWPTPFIHTINKLLSYDRQDRFQTAAELERQLLQMSAQDVSTAPGRNGSYHDLYSTASRTFVFVNLFPGAGATYATLSFARALNSWSVPHAVLEYPGNVPELYHLLDGERSCPKDYTFLQQRFSNDQHKEWTSGSTIWLPLHPASSSIGKDGKTLISLAKNNSLTLIDVSSAWTHRHSDDVINEADVIFIVADAQPAKFNNERSAKRMDYAIRLKEGGKEVHFIANRMYAWKGHKQWLNAFPWTPICCLPFIEYKHILRCAYAGKLIQDDPTCLKQNNRAWLPFMKKWLGNKMLA